MSRESVDWGLRDAKVGDLVRVERGGGWGPTEYSFLRVTKALKLRVTLGNGSVWTRAGKEWGSDIWAHTSAHLVLDEKKAREEVAEAEADAKLERDQRRARDFVESKWKMLTREQVDVILGMRTEAPDGK